MKNRGHFLWMSYLLKKYYYLVKNRGHFIWSFLFFVRLTVCDIHGISRGKLVPSRSAEAVLEKGMGSYIGKFMDRPFKNIYVPEAQFMVV